MLLVTHKRLLTARRGICNNAGCFSFSLGFSGRDLRKKGPFLVMIIILFLPTLASKQNFRFLLSEIGLSVINSNFLMMLSPTVKLLALSHLKESSKQFIGTRGAYAHCYHVQALSAFKALSSWQFIFVLFSVNKNIGFASSGLPLGICLQTINLWMLFISDVGEIINFFYFSPHSKLHNPSGDLNRMMVLHTEMD